MIAHYHACSRCGAVAHCFNESCTDDDYCRDCAANDEAQLAMTRLNPTIAHWRGLIDMIDAALFEMLDQRVMCVVALSKLKRRMSIDLYEEDREREIITNALQRNTGAFFDDAAVVRLVEAVIRECKLVAEKESA